MYENHKNISQNYENFDSSYNAVKHKESSYNNFNSSDNLSEYVGMSPFTKSTEIQDRYYSR